MLAASVFLLEARSFLALSIAEGVAALEIEGTAGEPDGELEGDAAVPPAPWLTISA
jgi:hypothetical protein